MQNITLAEDKTERVLEYMFFGHFVDGLSRRWDDNVYLPKETGLFRVEIGNDDSISTSTKWYRNVTQAPISFAHYLWEVT